ncbi:MAG TPA: hypothetical protein VGL93_11935 [Streptosporangiaceae bacterium]
MNTRDFALLKALLLALMEEDFVALWEVEAEVNSAEAGLTAERKRERAVYGVRELLRRGWARACWAADGDDEPATVPDDRIGEVLADDERWAPAHPWEPGFRLAVTDAGERAFRQIDAGERDAGSPG